MFWDSEEAQEWQISTWSASNMPWLLNSFFPNVGKLKPQFSGECICHVFKSSYSHGNEFQETTDEFQTTFYFTALCTFLSLRFIHFCNNVDPELCSVSKRKASMSYPRGTHQDQLSLTTENTRSHDLKMTTFSLESTDCPYPYTNRIFSNRTHCFRTDNFIGKYTLVCRGHQSSRNKSLIHGRI